MITPSRGMKETHFRLFDHADPASGLLPDLVTFLKCSVGVCPVHLLGDNREPVWAVFAAVGVCFEDLFGGGCAANPRAPRNHRIAKRPPFFGRLVLLGRCNQLSNTPIG